MRLLTISALLIATCAIFLGVGQSEETAKIEDVKESPIENDLTDVEKGEKLLDSFERDEANNDKDGEGGKGEENRGEVPEEENKDEKEDENDEIDSSSLRPDSFERDEANNEKDGEGGKDEEEEDRGEVPEEENKDEKEDEIDSSSLGENEVNSLEETSSDTKDTTGLSKRFFRSRRWRRFVRKTKRFGNRVVRKIRRFGNRVVRKTKRFGNRVVRKTKRFGNRVIRFGGRVLGSAGKIGNNVIGFGTGVVGGLGDKIANPFLDIMARKLKLIKKKFGKTCRLIKFSVGLEVKIPKLSWECFITEQKIALPPIKAADEENAGVQSDETVVHRFREDLSENDFAKFREFEAKAEKEVPQPRE